MVKCGVMVDERGVRIGEGHHKAVLTDSEVAQLLADRGPEELPAMTYLQLAKRYGISKGCVASIVSGRTRGLQGRIVARVRVVAAVQPKVRAVLELTISDRALLVRLGGAKWLRKVLQSVRNKDRNKHL